MRVGELGCSDIAIVISSLRHMFRRHLEPLTRRDPSPRSPRAISRTFSVNDHQAADLEGAELLHGVVHAVILVDGEVHVVVAGLLVGVGGEVVVGIFRGGGEGTSGGGGDRKHVLGGDGGRCRDNSGPGKCHG